MSEKLNWKRLLITIGIVVLTAGAVGGATWYVMDNQNKKDKAEAERQIAALDKLTKESKTTTATSTTTASKPADETASWKTYTSSKYGFTIKYPTDWTYGENENTSSGNEYWGGNVFSENNVIFKNTSNQVGIGINMSEIYGRGGTCVKRNVNYSAKVLSGKVSLTKTRDVSQSQMIPEGEMCGGTSLGGYGISVETFKQGGVDYFLHSEQASVTDQVATETIAIFEKMMGTMTFK